MKKIILSIFLVLCIAIPSFSRPPTVPPSPPSSSVGVHSSSHNVGGSDVIDRLFEGATEATITTTGDDPDTDGIVVSKGLYNTTGLTIAFDDFVAGVDGDHTGFSQGDYFGIYMNADTASLDCSGNSNMECNADTDFTGHATQVQLVIFVYRSTGWYSPNLTMGMSDALTLSVGGIGAQTPISGTAANFASTFTGASLKGGTYRVTTAGALALPDPAIGHNFSIIHEIAGASTINPLTTGTADTIWMNGLAADQDEDLTASAIGASCVFQYQAPNTWMAWCNDFTEATPP